MPDRKTGSEQSEQSRDYEWTARERNAVRRIDLFIRQSLQQRDVTGQGRENKVEFDAKKCLLPLFDLVNVPLFTGIVSMIGNCLLVLLKQAV